MTMSEGVSDHVQRNRVEWDIKAASYAEWAARAWSAEELTWGELRIPDARIGVLPASVDGLDIVELGCGTAYLSAQLAKRGANARMLRANGFEVEALVELQADDGWPGSTDPLISADWARQWPAEEIWSARKR